MSKLGLITAALLIVPSPVLAQIVFDDSPPPPATPGKGAKAKGVDKVVCRRQDTIGSRLDAHQVCMTVEQWNAYEQAYKQQVSEIQSKAQAPASN